MSINLENMDDAEVHKIMDALGAWFDDQDVGMPEAVLVMATMVGSLLGYMSDGRDDLAHGLQSLQDLLKGTARDSFKQKSRKSSRR